jgi:polyphosphate kinase 2 (PPK2 family)
MLKRKKEPQNVTYVFISTMNDRKRHYSRSRSSIVRPSVSSEHKTSGNKRRIAVAYNYPHEIVEIPLGNERQRVVLVITDTNTSKADSTLRYVMRYINENLTLIVGFEQPMCSSKQSS